MYKISTFSNQCTTAAKVLPIGIFMKEIRMVFTERNFLNLVVNQKSKRNLEPSYYQNSNPNDIE